MIRKIIHKVLRQRHFWRESGFDELSELYVSMMFRSMSINMTGLFVPLYMLRLDYGIVSILSVIAWYFTFRFLFADILAGYAVARYGPKHTMLVGYILLLLSTLMFLYLPSTAWPIWLLGGLWGASASFFFIPFNVDFSKVKHSKYGGKELGYINIMDKIGSLIGPIIGGAVATLFDPRYIFLVAVIFLLFSILPLFETSEPVKLGQKLDFNGLKTDKLKWDFLSVVGLGIENSLTMFLWPLYLGVFVLTGAAAYAKLGILWSVSILIAILVTHIIGGAIDKHKGRKLLRYSATINSSLHILRPLITTYPLAFLTNIANDSVTVGYRLPYIKGLYDAADDLPGYRIVYLTSIELVNSLSKATMWWFLVILAGVLQSRMLFVAGFMIAAFASLLIMTERFKALKPSKL